jgi:hypothetical protein
MKDKVMDTGLNIRPVQTVSSAPVRSDPPVARQTVSPVLPEAQAVTAASEDAPVRLNERAGQRELRAALNAAIDDRVPRAPIVPVSKVVQDEATKELVFRKISPETGEVIGQFPEEAVLRNKAYSAQLRREDLTAQGVIVA